MDSRPKPCRLDTRLSEKACVVALLGRHCAGLPRAFGALGRDVRVGPKHQRDGVWACLTFLPAAVRLSLVLRTLRKARASYALPDEQSMADRNTAIKPTVGVGEVGCPTLSLYERRAARVSDDLLRHCSPARILNVYRYASGAAWLAFLASRPIRAPRHSSPAFAGKRSRLAVSNGRPVPINGRGLPQRAQHECQVLMNTVIASAPFSRRGGKLCLPARSSLVRRALGRHREFRQVP